MKGKQVLITGASGTIGGEIAKKLFNEGAKPILWGQDIEKLMQLSKDLKGAKYNSLNLEKPEEIETNLKKLIKSEEVYGLVHVAAPPLNPNDPEFRPRPAKHRGWKNHHELPGPLPRQDKDRRPSGKRRYRDGHDVGERGQQQAV